MAYLYINDGAPESEDYNNNYFYFDESEPQALSRIREALGENSCGRIQLRYNLDRICKPGNRNPVWLFDCRDGGQECLDADAGALSQQA